FEELAGEGRRGQGAGGHRGGVALRQAQLARGPRADVQLLSGHDDAQEQLRLRDDQPGRGRLDEAGDEAGGREADGLDRRLEGLRRRRAKEAASAASPGGASPRRVTACRRLTTIATSTPSSLSILIGCVSS